MFNLVFPTFVALLIIQPTLLAKENQSFHGKTPEECHKAFLVFGSQVDHQSQSDMIHASFMERECLQKVMIQNLDTRLLVLKANDSSQFKTEMDLQKQFNNAIKEFSAYYTTKCEGNGCRMCDPSGALFSAQANQAAEINANKLHFEKRQISEDNKKIVVNYFGAFAKNLCLMPKDIWKAGHIDFNCVDLVDGELMYAIRFFFRENNEGDLCAIL